MAQGNLVPTGVGAPGFDPFSILRREVEQLFDGVSRGGALQDAPAATVVAPRINVSENDREITITAELPGMRPEDVSVVIADDMLTIRAEHEEERESDRRNYHLIERRVGVFQRSLRLPFRIDPEQVDARVDNGVLTIKIAKTDATQRSHRIAVGSGDNAGTRGDGDGAGSSAALSGSSGTAAGSGAGSSAATGSGTGSGKSSEGTAGKKDSGSASEGSSSHH
ncbi:MAG TPA: Hsp20/alpha crystallin family protein [Caldimonas sp.]|jgi:HSP20 family protein|nr:Hsp20/alpha crystallin family protein [Caldimonas sp.]